MSEVAAPATRKIRIHLSALARMEFSEVLEVPASLSGFAIQSLMHRRYEQVDAGEFTEDLEYWERGDFWFEAADASEAIDGRVVMDGVAMDVEEVGLGLPAKRYLTCRNARRSGRGYKAKEF